MRLTGQSIIGFSRGAGSTLCPPAISPHSGKELEPIPLAASETEIQTALTLAKEIFPSYASSPAWQRGAFLRKIANNIEQATNQLISLGMLEAALSEERMQMEIRRTIQQLELFAEMAETGEWLNPKIDPAEPKRLPQAKVDLRSINVALGPVVVFTAANFPLAYSVAGGDTASALAAGCPVIVKGHPAHPALSECIGLCILDAAESTQIPEGVFSLLFGIDNTLGSLLVSAPEISAVGFTGSLEGGRALMDIAAARPRPIPVFAEMGSINPVILTPESLQKAGPQLAKSYFDSLTQGAGQFCTNPGLLLLPTQSEQPFIDTLLALLNSAPPSTMLNPTIFRAFQKAQQQQHSHPQVQPLLQPRTADHCQVTPALATITGSEFLNSPELCSEVFGPAALIVTYADRDELATILSQLPGQLTASLHCPENDLSNYQSILQQLTHLAGRIILNGFPTGVEVCQSMVHGGPYPASSDSRTTSVGHRAILRFCRPVALQNFPLSALPQELK